MKAKLIYLMLFFSILGVFFASCVPDKKGQRSEPPFNLMIREILDQNKRELFLSDFGQSISYVALESKPGFLLNFIYKIQQYQENIFVSDRERVYQFDKNGRFVREIGKVGRGPGEHTGRVRFAINPYRGQLLIYSFPTKLINVYQALTGEFLYSFNFDYYVSDFSFNQNDQLVIFTDEGSIDDLNFSVNEAYLIDYDKKVVVDSIFNPLRTEKRSQITGHVILYQNQNNAFYSFNYNDTLFVLDKNFIRRPIAAFNLENKISHLNLKLDYGISAIQFPDFLYLENVIENSNFFFLRIGKGFAIGVEMDIRKVLFCKKERKSWEINKLINDLDGGLPFWPRWVSDGVLINYFNPYELIDYYEKTKGEITHSSDFVHLLKNLKETDNPVIVFVE